MAVSVRNTMRSRVPGRKSILGFPLDGIVEVCNLSTFLSSRTSLVDRARSYRPNYGEGAAPAHARTRVPRAVTSAILDLLGEDSWRNVYTGELEMLLPLRLLLHPDRAFRP